MVGATCLPAYLQDMSYVIAICADDSVFTTPGVISGRGNMLISTHGGCVAPAMGANQHVAMTRDDPRRWCPECTVICTKGAQLYRFAALSRPI